MSGLILLAIGLASLGLVLAMLAYCGIKAWRVFKRGAQAYEHVSPLLNDISDWSIKAEARAQELADNGEQIAANVACLQVSVQRLQVVAEAFEESMQPYRRARRYLGA